MSAERGAPTTALRPERLPSCLTADTGSSSSPTPRSVISRWNASSLDYLVCAREQRLRNCNSERLSRPLIDNQLDFRRLLDRQVAGLLAVEDAAGIHADPTVRIGQVSPVAGEAPGRDE